jgi:hypothetical protein
MKSAAGKGRPEAGRSYDENLTPAITIYLKTLVLLQRGFGQSYLTRIVRGDDGFEFWKSPDPRAFETFGKLATREWDFCILVLHVMVAHELVEVNEPGFNVFVISEKGRAFLENPYDLYEPKKNLRYSRYEKYLRGQLTEYRRQCSASNGIPVWEILPEYTLDRITIEKPSSVDALEEIPGMVYFRMQSIGAGLLSVMQESVPDFKVHEVERITELAKTGQYQVAKEALSRNSNVAGVARDMGCDPGRAFYYVECLAIAEQVNLKKWIEKQVDASTLYRGSEYFLKAKEPGLSEGFRTLGIDYDTLKLCRIYSLYVTPDVPTAVSA